MKAIGDTGFTLIELLVVVAIIGVLAAIAIPQVASYRQRGYDYRAESDLRNAASAEEAYFVAADTYVADSCSDSTNNRYTTLQQVTCSRGVELTITAAARSFIGTAFHKAGAITFTYDSTAGGITNGN